MQINNLLKEGYLRSLLNKDLCFNYMINKCQLLNQCKNIHPKYDSDFIYIKHLINNSLIMKPTICYHFLLRNRCKNKKIIHKNGQVFCYNGENIFVHMNTLDRKDIEKIQFNNIHPTIYIKSEGIDLERLFEKSSEELITILTHLKNDFESLKNRHKYLIDQQNSILYKNHCDMDMDMKMEFDMDLIKYNYVPGSDYDSDGEEYNELLLNW